MRILFAACAAITMASSAQAVTVVNGSFETGVPIPSGSVFLAAPPIDTTSIPGWRILSSGVDYVDKILWDARTGRRSVELAGIGSGGIQQRVDNQLITGRNYRIRFSLSANPFADDGTYEALVSATGGGAEYFSYTKTAANTPTNMLYQTYDYFFTAGGPSASFQFRSRGNGAQGVILDNVSISLVPEPAQWMLLIMGFGMTGYAMRRRAIPSVTA
jgi:hypothetical protein